MSRHHNVALIGVDAAHGIAVARLVDDSMMPKYHAGDVVVGDSGSNGLGDTLLLWDSGKATFAEVENDSGHNGGDVCKFRNAAYGRFHLTDVTLQRNCPLNYGVVAHLTPVDGKYVSLRTRL